MEVTECQHRPTLLKEYITYIYQEKGAHHTTQGLFRRQRSEGEAWARAFTGASSGKERQSKVNNAGLASMNYSRGLCATRLSLVFW